MHKAAVQADLNPVRLTDSVTDWLLANREGLLIGAIVAGAIILLMLIMRAIGNRGITRRRTDGTLHK